MSHLIPEKRLDKNGVLTTKHVRATPRASTSRKTTPAPRLAPAPKGLKLRPSQTEQRGYVFRSFAYETGWSMRKHNTTKDYSFTASEAEIYDVLSVAHMGNALLLLEQGIRTADDARAYLLKNGEDDDLIVDHSEITQEMLKRNISPHQYLENTNTGAGRVQFDSPFLADAIEFSTIKTFDGAFHRAEVREYILYGEISLADIKTIGVSRLKDFDRLRGIQSTLRQYHKGELGCSIEDIRDFVIRANGEGLVLGHFKDAVQLLHHLGPEKADELKTLRAFSSNFNPKAADLHEEAHRAHYSAVLMEGLEEADVARPMRYFGVEFPNDAELLRSAGIKAQDAYPLMNDGMSAQQVVGVLNGVNASVAEGWL